MDLAPDVLVVGGGMGGIPAAWQASRLGYRTVLTEETDWLGGQMTSQGVPALDEHAHIETFGGTATYTALREAIREYYRTRYRWRHPPPSRFNPGRAWVSRLCFEPRAALWAIDRLLGPQVAAGHLTVLLRTRPVAVERAGDRIASVTLATPEGTVTVRPRFVVDATELGDLLPLAGLPYHTGQESREETGEPHAPPDPRPEAVQSFTFPVGVRWVPEGGPAVPAPPGYARYRDTQPYTLTLPGPGGTVRRFAMRAPGDTGLPFWTYRRLVDASQFEDPALPHDLAVLNWPSNDYAGPSFLDRTHEERAQIWEDARRLSLGFLHWLQTECPRDDGGRGYPEIQPEPGLLGTEDALSKFPYIREARRLRAARVVVESDIVASPGSGPRARPFPDAVGIGWYPIDIHATAGHGPGLDLPTLPFQIPLSALYAPELVNFLVGGKAMGTTHITNGAYRLHPVEWAAGEAAGAAASWCLAHRLTPGELAGNPVRFQRFLAESGIPIFWAVDVPLGHRAFVAIQVLGAQGYLPTGQDLDALPDQPVGRDEAAAWLQAVVHRQPRLLARGGAPPLTRRDLRQMAAALGIALPLAPGGEDTPVLRGELAEALLPLLTG